MLQIEPSSLIFRDVKLNQAYTSTITITNPLSVTVDFTLKPSSSKYTLSPSKIALNSNDSIVITIRLLIPHYTNYTKDLNGKNDYISIKSLFFEQKIETIYYLHENILHNRSRTPSPARNITKSVNENIKNLNENNNFNDLLKQIEIKDKLIKQQQSIINELQSANPSLSKVINDSIEQERLQFEEKSEKVSEL